ncbi:hypothetical protein EI94DRAFT_340269 [Lactarius quietus]|nr:hypothetical protein EI94DRAFT_340269 [Lactarius quietus]
MQFRSLFKKKKTQETKSAMSSGQPPRAIPTSASSTTFGVPDNDTVQMSLLVLFEGTSLASKLPYISSIAGLLLQVLSMREEVKYYKNECKVLERKLDRVAKIVVNVGELCSKHSLNEEDLPVGLRAILHSHIGELDEIKRVVTQCTEIKGIKRLFLRHHLRLKIKQCDGELSVALQAFQATLSLEICFALLSKKREVRLGLTDI